MTQMIFNQENGEDPLQGSKAFGAELMNWLGGVQQMMTEYEQLKQRVAALERENAALTDTLEQWKNNDEWSNRVTYENVVEQIASLEDTAQRDNARRLIEPLLKRGQVNQLRKDIKRRVKELNEEGDGFSDKEVAQVLEACVGKGLVVDAKWKWVGVYWYLRWTCNYPVDAKEFCAKIKSLDLDIPAEYECSYESIRKICTLSFMDYDPRRMEYVRVSKNDQNMFSQCREIVLKIATELGKTRLAQE
ncbi:MAG: hypothetical protein IKW98_06425 [Prevotella sp.]|nr:hypothetical protein [Prevotella sp.]